MKTLSLLGGVAALALAATAATAGEIDWGQNQSGNAPGPGGSANANHSNSHNGASSTSAWHAHGGAENNNGTASSSDGATFTLKGNVTTDCAFYSGTGNQTLDFGQIGIYASDNTGPANAFTMVDDADLDIDTNLAGCNTRNRVTVTKDHVDGMRNTGNTGGYDTAVFQNNLPYSINTRYTAGPANSAAAGSAQSLLVAANAVSANRLHGAWKSAMEFEVRIPKPSKALLAGNYEGAFTVLIAAE